jgi:NAD-dependent deacetylase
MSTVYITGAGVSAESGIPTFRGQDGFWTVGSINYTPQEMATRTMYLNAPDEFLLWYFRRFASYRQVMPNAVHHWLSDKRLITQNIDGLDGKAGNPDYIAIHGRLDKVTMLHQQGELVPLLDAPWEQVVEACPDLEDDQAVKSALLDAFRISKTSLIPEIGHSLKPFVLLFDEYYTDLYRMGEAEDWMSTATRFVFMGTSFSVNITNIALRAAIMTAAEIDVVDPSPIDLNIDRVTYHAMSAAEFIAKA